MREVFNIRIKAIRKIKDQNVLVNILIKEKEDWIYKRAIDLILTQKSLLKIINSSEELRLQEIAINKLIDVEMLKELNKKGKSFWIRSEAERRLEKLKIKKL